MKSSELEQNNWWDSEILSRSDQLRQQGNGRLAGGDWSVWATIVGGSALVSYGLLRRDRAGLASAVAGSALLFQGTRRVKDTALAEKLNPEMDLEYSVTLLRPAEDLYSFWQNAANLPRFMYNVRRIEELGNNRQRWVFVGPRNREISVQIEIISRIPNRLISWQTEPGQPYEEWGSVEFTPSVRQDETEVSMTISYRLPAGYLGKGLASLAGLDPAMMTRESLRRFKQLMEAGEIATTQGQSSGRRGLVSKGMQMLLGERSQRPVLQASRRAG